MPFKDPAKRKSYQQKYHNGWYAQNGTNRKKQVAERRRALKQRYSAYKATLKCGQCGLSGEDNAWALEFHHRNRQEKTCTVSHLVTSGYGWERIMEEIDKCIVSCANCHRKEHYEEMKERKASGLSGASTPIENDDYQRIGLKKQRAVHRRERQRALDDSKATDESTRSGPNRKS
jgi:hypothetical protein